MKTHKLMIKTHNITGLKYLCYTKKSDENYNSYLGSGTVWKRHLKKHGEDISTELLFETEDHEIFKNVAIKTSIKYNIVVSKEWANLMIEQGEGGDTVSNRIWITDGQQDKYHYKTDVIPDGWQRGRSKCIFNDKNKQTEFSNRRDPKNQSIALTKAWADGKFDKRVCNPRFGDDNPSKRPEVKEKMRQTALKTSKVRSERVRRVKPWEYRWKKEI